MRRAAAKFQKESLYSSVQFGFNEDSAIFESEREVLFGDFDYEWWFFIPDMFFMLTICWLVSIVYKKLKASREKKYISYNFFKWTLLIFGICSIVFDWYENVQYLGGLDAVPMYWSGVSTWKSTCISIFLALTLLYSLLHFFDTNPNSYVDEDASKSLSWNPHKMLVVFRGSAISILILMVIGMGLTLLDQGATLVVHLLDQASTYYGFIQIIMTVLLINLLAIIISHYPEYLQNAIEPSKKIRWHINWVFGFIPGLITFTSIHHDDHKYVEALDEKHTYSGGKKTEAKYANYVSLFRYYLGVLTYVAWFYVMYKAFDLYSLTKYDAWSSVFLWSLLVCIIIYYLYRAHSRDARDLVSEIGRVKRLDPAIEQTFTVDKGAIDKVRPWVNAYTFFLFLTIGIAFVAMFVFAKYGWHKYAFFASIAFLLSNTFLYVFFRFTRLYIKFVWFDADYIKHLFAKDHELAFAGDSKVSISVDNDQSNNIFKKLVGNVSSNYYFLNYMRIIAMLSSLYLVWSYFTMDSYITKFSAIPLTLSFLMIVYIIIIYPIKFHMAYGNRQYNEQGDNNQDAYYSRKKKYLWIVSLLGVFLFLISTVGGADNLHKLYYVKSEDHETVKQFSDNLNEYIASEMVVDKNTVTPMLKITSFGGGLKSNLWTLLTMSALDDGVSATMPAANSKKRILDYTLSLSGVSGGAVGLGNYLVLDYMNRKNGPEKYNRNQVVQNIGKENVLAIDVSGLFGHDRIKSTITFGSSADKPNFDRSYFAMRRYMKILTKENEENLNTLTNSSIAEYWKEMKKGVKHNPALIINTASTGYQPGVVFSLKSDAVLFPGYIELSDEVDEDGIITPKGLRYYDAVSTSNRFPVMSPAGQIEDEGFFLDGGYFDNSGLLTTEHFYNDLKSRSEIVEKYPTGTVVILNGKSDYTRRFIDLMGIKQTEINVSTNTAAIIAGITNIDKLPNVLLTSESTYSDSGDLLFKIYMPHPISIDDIYASLSGEFVINEEVFAAMKENNRKVNQALKDYGVEIDCKGVVVPPLARTLSAPAVDYQTAMIMHHPDVKSQIQDVVDYIKDGVPIGGNSTTVVADVPDIIDYGSLPTSDSVTEVSDYPTETYSSVGTVGTPVEIDTAIQKALDILKSLPDKEIVKKRREKINANEILKTYYKKEVKEQKEE